MVGSSVGVHPETQSMLIAHGSDEASSGEDLKVLRCWHGFDFTLVRVGGDTLVRVWLASWSAFLNLNLLRNGTFPHVVRNGLGWVGFLSWSAFFDLNCLWHMTLPGTASDGLLGAI